MFTEVLLAVLVILFFYGTIQHLLRRPNIPGPFPLPFIGNLHQLSAVPYKDFSKWRKKYGDVFTVYFGSSGAVVVNSIEFAREALVKKDKDFAGRSPPPFLTTIVEPDSGIVTADFSPRLMKQRKVLHAALRMFGSGKDVLEVAIQEQVGHLLDHFDGLTEKEFNPTRHIYFTVSAVMFKMMFGKSYNWNDEEFLQYLDALEIILASLNVKQWMNVFPILRVFPGSGFKRILDAANLRDDILSREFEGHCKTFDPNNIRDITDSLIKAKMDEEEDDNTKLLSDKNLIMMMDNSIIGGTDTASITILWSMIYFVRNPNIQQKIQHEIDAVVGRERRPELKDRSSLPYMEATVTEVLRLSSILPLDVPHFTTCDTSLGQYKIRKGTVVFFNLWEMSHDPECWESPNEFNPGRFIDENGMYVHPGKRSWLPFSAGRRVCVGETLAKMELFLFLSSLLQRYTFENPPDQPLPDQDGEYKGMLVAKPFNILIKKRF